MMHCCLYVFMHLYLSVIYLLPVLVLLKHIHLSNDDDTNVGRAEGCSRELLRQEQDKSTGDASGSIHGERESVCVCVCVCMCVCVCVCECAFGVHKRE